MIYDLNVLEFATQYWQTGQDFARISEILDMPSSTDIEIRGSSALKH